MSARIVAFAVAILGSVLLRIECVPFVSGDMWRYNLRWFGHLKTLGHAGLRHPFTNYTPAYEVLLLAATHLSPPLSAVAATKFVSICGDYVCAVLLYGIVRLRFPMGWRPAAAMLAHLYSPTVLLNSAYWGQTDSLYAAGILACLYLLCSGRTGPAMASFGVALAVKQQALFFAPALLLLLLRKELPLRHALVPLAVLAASMVPVWLVGRPLMQPLEVYVRQASTYRAPTLGFPNFYSWVHTIPLAIALAIATASVVAFLLVLRRHDPPRTVSSLALTGLLSVLLMPMVLPRMHERYWYLADVISVACAFLVPRCAIVAVLTVGCSLCAYAPVLFRCRLVSTPYLALVTPIPLLLAADELRRLVTRRPTDTAQLSGPR
jgi:Gpi18-like mannosyltransferase